MSTARKKHSATEAAVERAVASLSPREKRRLVKQHNAERDRRRAAERCSAPVASSPPWTHEDVRDRLETPLDDLAVDVDMACARPELAEQREDLLALARILRATAEAWRASRAADSAKTGEKRARQCLNKLALEAGRYLRSRGKDERSLDLIDSMPSLVKRMRGLAKDRVDWLHFLPDGRRRDFGDTDVARVAEGFTDGLLRMLGSVAAKELRAKLSPQIDRAAVVTAVTAAFGSSDPQDARSVDAVWWAALHAAGYLRPALLADALRKRARNV
jgi:hypothetical protein